MKRGSLLNIFCAVFMVTAALGCVSCGGVGGADNTESLHSDPSISGNGCVHNWETSVTKEANCEENGLAVHVCSLCGEDYSEILHALGHDEKTHAAQEVTCEQGGWAQYVTCERDGCDYSTYAYQDALGHQWGNGKCNRCQTPYFTQTLHFELSDNKTYYIVLWDTDDTNTEIIVPATYNGLPVKEIRAWAFSYNKKITSVQLPDSITKIGGYAFHECTALKNINFPKNLETIDENAFAYCSGLTGKLVFPTSLKAVGYSAFAKCEGLTEIVLPKSLEVIAQSAFDSCASLKTVDVGGAILIGSGAFFMCSALETVKISKNLKQVDQNAFATLSDKVLTVYYEGSADDWDNLLFMVKVYNEALIDADIHFNSY